MFNKKFLILLLVVFIVSLGCVSAQEDANVTALGCENPDISSVDDGIGTADILADGDSHGRFNVSNDTLEWRISVLDDEGNYVTEGSISFLDKSVHIDEWVPYAFLDLYEYYDYFPGNITFHYEGNYQVDDLTVYVDSLVDTINASDVVDGPFSATLYDEYGNILSDKIVEFHVLNDDLSYDKKFYRYTDYDGVATLDVALPIGNYTVNIFNSEKKQHKCCWWNITKEDEDKFVNITVFQDANILVVSAVDKYGNNVTGANFRFISESSGMYIDFDGNPSVPFNLYFFDIDEYPLNITIEFSSDDFYPATTVVSVGSLNDTIGAGDVVDADSFSATFYDAYGNPLADEKVAFNVYKDDFDYYKYFYPETDSEGVATLDVTLPMGNYTVDIYNTVTGQEKSYLWIITKEDESRFVNISVSQEDNFLVVSAVDKDGNYVTEGTFTFASEYSEKISQHLDGDSSVLFSLYELDFDDYPQDILIEFLSDYFYYTYTFVFIGSLNDTIDAGDVVDGPFSATFYDTYGNALVGEEVVFKVYNYGTYENYFYSETDSEGVAALDVAIPMGNYTVNIRNPSTGQRKSYWWNITKEDESKVVNINVSQDGGFLIVSAVDRDGNNVTDGKFNFISDNYEIHSEYLSEWNSYVIFSLYEFDINGYPQNISIEFESNYYLQADTSVFIDSLNDSIVAEDVVDKTTFSAKLLDSYGNPVSENARFLIQNDDYTNSIYDWSDLNGDVSIDLALPIGNYTVEVYNYATNQHKSYWWNITKLDDNKTVEISAYQDGNYLIVSAVDKEGNNVTEGFFKLIDENNESRFINLYDDSFISFNLLIFGFDSYPQNIEIEFISYKFNPANTTFYVDSVIDTIDAGDVAGEDSFSAAFYDEFGNVLIDERVSFYIQNDEGTVSEYVYVTTDSDGVVSICLALMPDNYTVTVWNTVTDQNKVCWWNITQKAQNKDSHINVTQKGYYIVFNVLNETGGAIDDGNVYIYDGDRNIAVYSINGRLINYFIYNLKEGYHNVTLIFKDSPYYFESNSTFTVYVWDTIKVNSSFYNTTTCTLQMLDYDGNPCENILVIFNVNDYEYEAVTGENGYLTFDFVLYPGTYEIKVYNDNSRQSKTFIMEILEKYDDKVAELHVSRDGYRFTINATDINGNIIRDGRIIVEDGADGIYDIIDGSLSFSYFDLLYEAEPNNEVNLTFIFDNHNYYPANASSSFTFIDTIILDSYYQKSPIFDATFLDIDGKALINGEVNFLVYTYNYYGVNTIANVTTQTDENGLAYIEIDDKYFDAYVKLTNMVTSQVKGGYWDNRKTAEITPIAEIVEGSTIYLPSGTKTISFELSPGATGSLKASTVGYSTDVDIVDGIVTVDVAKNYYVLHLYYYGDSNFTDSDKEYTLIVGSLYTPEMTVSEDIEADYLDDVNFTVNLKYGESPISDASIELVIGNNTYNGITDKNGNLFVPLALDAGSYNVSVTYKGNTTYYSVKKSTALTINKIDAQISVNESVDYGEKLIVTVEGNATGQIIVEIDTNKFNGTISDNAAIIELSGLAKGTYDAVISYSGDNNYNNNSIKSKITVNPLTLNINASADPVTVGDDVVIIVIGFEDATGNVTLALNGKAYTAPIVDGEAVITVPGLVENATAVITYAGDDKYNNASAEVVIVVNPKAKENATISIDAPEITEGENATVTVTLPSDATGTVTIGNETVDVVNGTASAVLTNLPVGNNTLPITYSGDDKYSPIESNVTISVKEDTSDIISAPDVTKYYKGPERFAVTVTDYQGNPLANKSVAIVINGQTYSRTTNANGIASVGLNLGAGFYKVTTTVDNQTVNSVVNILATVNGTDLVKVFKNATQYYATFRDTNGNYLAEGTTVKFNINGVMYERKVTQNGLAKLNINLPQGQYIITAINPETGEMASNIITVIPRIIENSDLTKYYKNASQYVVTVLGDDGQLAKAGEVVTFNINGVFYNRTVNESGQAKLNINLAAGNYVITAEYKGCKVANNITVLPILSAKDITMKYRDGTKFTATLVDGQGKPYAGQSVQFNINGVLYNRVTDSSGQAKLNINLMAGKYIITSSYNGANIANTITISA